METLLHPSQLVEIPQTHKRLKLTDSRTIQVLKLDGSTTTVETDAFDRNNSVSFIPRDLEIERILIPQVQELLVEVPAEMIRQIEGVFRFGHFNGFYPIQQPMSALGISRNLHCMHEQDPDHVYVFSGVGVHRANKQGTRHVISDPDPTQTVEGYVCGLFGSESKMMTTSLVLENGEHVLCGDTSPLGAYIQDESVSKAINTSKAQRVLETYASTPEIIYLGGYTGSTMEAVVYRIPLCLRIDQVVDIELGLTPNLRYGLSEEFRSERFIHFSISQLAAALSELHRANYVHNQLHMGNWSLSIRNGSSPAIIITDFSTLQDISPHEKLLRANYGEYGLDASPYLYAIIQDASRCFECILEIAENSLERYDNLASLDLAAAFLQGYLGRDFLEELFGFSGTYLEIQARFRKFLWLRIKSSHFTKTTEELVREILLPYYYKKGIF